MEKSSVLAMVFGYATMVWQLNEYLTTMCKQVYGYGGTSVGAVVATVVVRGAAPLCMHVIDNVE
jgi:hypothetical protein